MSRPSDRFHEAAVWRGVTSESRVLIEQANARALRRRVVAALADAIQAEIPDSDIEDRDIVEAQAAAILDRLAQSGFALAGDEG